MIVKKRYRLAIDFNSKTSIVLLVVFAAFDSPQRKGGYFARIRKLKHNQLSMFIITIIPRINWMVLITIIISGDKLHFLRIPPLLGFIARF